jgi:hypothetical protein
MWWMPMKRKPFWPVIVFVFLFLSSCCGEIRAGDQNVNVLPLYNVHLDLKGVEKMSDVINVNIFDIVEINEPTYLWVRGGPSNKLPEIQPASSFDIAFSLSESTNAALENFSNRCDRLGWTSAEIVYGGETDNQYCISYVQELRAPPDGYCQPTNQYVSYVIFLKDRLVISIEENIYSETGHDLVFSKDAVILKLAEELAK